MASMIYTVSSIALFALLLYSQVNYANPAARQAAEMADRLERGLVQLQQGFAAYEAAVGVVPNSIDEITPSYAFLPPTLGEGLAWTYGAGGAGNAGRYFCLSGPMNVIQVEALKKLVYRVSPQAYFINQACGAEEHVIPVFNNGTQPVAMTFWVKR